MFIRIVKLTLKEDRIKDFLDHFNSDKEKIRHYPGCQFLEVYQDKHQDNIFFTYSYWDEEQSLENYKKSELFGQIWPNVKAMFKERAEAWSVDKVVTLN